MIEGTAIRLATLESQDSEALFAWINDPSIVHLHGPFRPVDGESHRRWMENLPQDKSAAVFAVRERWSREGSQD